MKIISASIDLNKIDKTKIIEGKNGAKYYNLSIIVNDTANRYGRDVSIAQEQTKEQREQKVPRVYLGNGKTVWSSEGKQDNSATVAANQQRAIEESRANSSSEEESQELPF